MSALRLLAGTDFQNSTAVGPFVLFGLSTANVSTAALRYFPAAAAVMFSHSVLTFAQRHRRYTTTLSPQLPTPPPAPPRHRRRLCCGCCWCLLSVFTKKNNRLSVVLVMVHIAAPVCAPAGWLLPAAVPHFLVGPSSPPAAALLPMLLLCAAVVAALTLSCACSYSMLLCSLLCSAMPCVDSYTKVRCFLYCILCVYLHGLHRQMALCGFCTG